jgi:hypothetical protein
MLLYPARAAPGLVSRGGCPHTSIFTLKLSRISILISIWT